MDHITFKKIASAIILDARYSALVGTKDDREDIQRWLRGEKAVWDFHTTCSLAAVDEIKLRNDITVRLIMRERAERRNA